MKARLNPVRLYIAGYDWAGRTTRTQFLIVAGFALAPESIARLLHIDMLTGGGVSVALTIWFALAAMPLVGHALRRLGDAGLSAWLVWFGAVPVLNLGLLAVLLVARTNARRLPEASSLRLIGQLIGGVVALAILSRIFLVPIVVETADMLPLIEPGDVVMIWRRDRTAEVGTLSVMIDPNSRKPVVRRVIARASSRVATVAGAPVIDGVAVTQAFSGFHHEIMEPRGPLGERPRCLSGSVGQGGDCQKRMIAETHPNGATYTVLDIGPSPLDTVAEVEVPEATVYVLSDNRDDATDSRIARAAEGLGFVPEADLRGRAGFVLMSFGGRAVWQVWTWRPERFLKGLL